MASNSERLIFPGERENIRASWRAKKIKKNKITVGFSHVLFSECVYEAYKNVDRLQRAKHSKRPSGAAERERIERDAHGHVITETNCICSRTCLFNWILFMFIHFLFFFFFIHYYYSKAFIFYTAHQQ